MTVRTIQSSSAQLSTARLSAANNGLVYQNTVQSAADVALNPGRQARFLWRFADDIGAATSVEALAMQTYYNPGATSTVLLECLDATTVSEGANHTGALTTIAAALGKTGSSINSSASSFTAWPGYSLVAGEIESVYGFRSLGSQFAGGTNIANFYGFYADEITRAVIGTTADTSGLAAGAWFVMPSGGETNIALMLAKGTAKPTFWIQDNASAFVIIQAADSTTSWNWVLPPNDGNAGQQLQTNGSGVTTWEAAASTREVKLLDGPIDPQEALDRVLSAPVYRFRYDPDRQGVGGDYETEFVGVVADEAPWVMMHKGRIFSPISAFGHAAAAIQALSAKVDELEARIA